MGQQSNSMALLGSPPTILSYLAIYLYLPPNCRQLLLDFSRHRREHRRLVCRDVPGATAQGRYSQRERHPLMCGTCHAARSDAGSHQMGPLLQPAGAAHLCAVTRDAVGTGPCAGSHITSSMRVGAERESTTGQQQPAV
jgi:hypothetical protein